MDGSPGWPVVSVGAVVVRGDEVLLIRRARAPLEGRWSVPGGRVEAGERLQEAVVREVREETGVNVRPGPLLTVFEPVERDAAGGRLRYHYVILDYLCEWVSGSPRADSDAAEARWVDRHDLPSYELPEATLEVVLAGLARAGS